jgi:hypothetical protein
MQVGTSAHAQHHRSSLSFIGRSDADGSCDVGVIGFLLGLQNPDLTIHRILLGSGGRGRGHVRTLTRARP